MTTTEIIVTILGALGGLGGISAFIKSFFFVRQDGDSKTISNLVSIIEEMHKNHNDLNDEFKSYKKEIKSSLNLSKFLPFLSIFSIKLTISTILLE